MGTDTQKMMKFSAALLVLIAAVAVVDGSKNVFVEFYAPWCGHCKRLTPEYEIVGDAFARTPEVVVAKVDADAHRSLGSRFGVTGFPTLKFFSKGSTEPTDYSGGRTAEDLVTYINDNSGTRAAIKKAPEAVVALTPSDFDEVVMDESKFALVEFYAPWCGHCKNLAPVYEKVAAAFANEEHCVVAKVDADKHKDLGGRYGVSGFPTILTSPRTTRAARRSTRAPATSRLSSTSSTSSAAPPATPTVRSTRTPGASTISISWPPTTWRLTRPPAPPPLPTPRRSSPPTTARRASPPSSTWCR